jgi:hypothetical protein
MKKQAGRAFGSAGIPFGQRNSDSGRPTTSGNTKSATAW